MKPGSVEVGGPAVEGEGRARRWVGSPEQLAEGKMAEIPTVFEVVKRSARMFPNQNGFGYRELVKVHTEEKEVEKTVKGVKRKEMKKWQYFELSDYKYLTYKEILDHALVIGSGLRALGLDKTQRFNIYSSTGFRWQLMAQGCVSQSITFATAYDSLGEEGLQHSLHEPEVVGMFLNANLLPTLSAVIKDTPTVKFVIYDGKAESAKEKEAIEHIRSITRPSSSEGGAEQAVRVLTYDELLELGKKEAYEPVPPTEDDVCCIMYTSGSTGAPKGVILTHKNICASTTAVKLLLVHLFHPGDSYIAYLPLAHILEFVVELVMIYFAIPVGYGSVKTLTDASVRNCKGDMSAFRPTIMVGVPQVWEQIRKGIVTKVKDGGKQGIFNLAMGLKKSSSLLGHIADAVVFNKVKQATGGRLRFALSGGAPISKETQEFLNTALVPLLQGYGMTESSAMCAILPPEYMRYGAVGVPVPCAEVKLVDVQDMGYSSKSKPPQGEIYLRGPSITQGYFKRPDLTKEALTDDGWFMTGDIGQWNSDGTLSIIDRKKNLVKLSGGEYIALEKLETTYKSCSLVANIVLHADSNARQPMAIVFPNEKNLRAAVKDAGFGYAADEDINTLCECEKTQELMLNELNAIGKKAKFKQMELLQCVVIDPEEWTPQNGMLTAAQKLQRKAIFKKHEAAIKKMYPGEH